jgi:hypothetical protein
MSILSPLISIWTWFKKNVIDHAKDAAKVAVTITETVKTLLNNPLTGFLLNLADGITHTQLPTEVATFVNNQIPKILAVELAIEGLPDNPTEVDILAFEQRVLTAFSVHDDKSKLYTVLAAQIYRILKDKLADGKLTFAEGVQAIQESWLAYQVDLAANTGVVDAPVGTVLPNGNIVVESAADALNDIKNDQVVPQ